MYKIIIMHIYIYIYNFEFLPLLKWHPYNEASYRFSCMQVLHLFEPSGLQLTYTVLYTGVYITCSLVSLRGRMKLYGLSEVCPISSLQGMLIGKDKKSVMSTAILHLDSRECYQQHDLTVSLNRLIIPLQHHSTTTHGDDSITTLQHHSTIAPCHYSVTPLLHHTTTASTHYSITPLLHHATTASLHYCIMPLQRHPTTA